MDILQLRKEHASRLSNASGAAGEIQAISSNAHWIERPKGEQLTILLTELKKQGIDIKRTSFDAISLPTDVTIDFDDEESVGRTTSAMTFIEIKTTNKESVKDDFSGYFFAFTEGELSAAEQLKERHQVALVNRRTGNILMSSVPQLLERARSMNWQVSVQL